MFQNNINGNNNKIRIKQNAENKSNALVEIIIGLIVTVVGGVILWFIVG